MVLAGNARCFASEGHQDSQQLPYRGVEYGHGTSSPRGCGLIPRRIETARCAIASYRNLKVGPLVKAHELQSFFAPIRVPVLDGDGKQKPLLGDPDQGVRLQRHFERILVGAPLPAR